MFIVLPMANPLLPTANPATPSADFLIKFLLVSILSVFYLCHDGFYSYRYLRFKIVPSRFDRYPPFIVYFFQRVKVGAEILVVGSRYSSLLFFGDVYMFNKIAIFQYIIRAFVLHFHVIYIGEK